MTRNDATIDVSGPAASTVAKSVLTTLGVEAGEVDSIEVTITTGNGDETVTTFDSEGPQAGAIAAEMIGAIDHDERPPKRVTVDLSATEGGGDDAGDGEDDEEPEEPVAEEPDEEPDEADVDEAGDGERLYRRLSVGSNGHLALSAVAAYYTMVTKEGEGAPDGSSGGGSSGGEGVTVAQLMRMFDLPIEREALVKALSRASRVNGVLEKYTRSSDTHGTVNGYTVNSLGAAFLAEKGAHPETDLDVSGVTDPEADGGENRYAKLREAAQGREGPTGVDRSGQVTMHDEPQVDDSKPVAYDTRKHECL